MSIVNVVFRNGSLKCIVINVCFVLVSSCRLKRCMEAYMITSQQIYLIFLSASKKLLVFISSAEVLISVYENTAVF